MKTEIVVTSKFKNEAKRFLKKYRSLKAELESLYLQLLENPKTGVPVDKNVFKIRISVKSKGKGKSGGLRVITYFQVNLIFDEEHNTLYLLSIYDKSETDTISHAEIETLIKLI
jgi:mRNA-degrading endonuclease RelE of RelBE toxin-antitoxin system